MISTIRKSFGKKFTQVLMWITLFSLAGLTSITGLFKRFSGLSDQTVAEVNGYPISLLTFKRKVHEEETKLLYYKQQYGPHAQALMQLMGMNTNPFESALQILMQEKLLVSAADKMSIELSHDYVMRKLHDPHFATQLFGDLVPPYLYNNLGEFDSRALVKYLQRQGMSVGTFEEELEQALRRYMMIQLTQAAVYVPAPVIKEQIIKDFAKRTFGIVTCSAADYEKRVDKNFSEQGLQSFFDSRNQTEKAYWVPEERTGIVWSFIPEQYGLQIAPDEIKKYYHDHKNKFIDKEAQVMVRNMVIKDEKEAQVLAQELAQYPARFAKLAGKETMVIAASSKHPQAIKDAALALMQDGAISPVVKTDKGFEILGRVSKKEATHKPLEAAEASIKQDLLKEKFVKTFGADMQQMARVGEDVFGRFGEQKKAQKKSITLKSTDKTIAGQLLFEAKQGTRAYKIDADGKGYMVELVAVKESYAPEFKTVKEQVQKDFVTFKALTAMQSDLQAMKEACVQGTTLSEIAKLYKVTYQHKTVTGKDDPAWQIMAQDQLPVQSMMELTRLHSCLADQNDQKGYLVSLESKEEVAVDAHKEKMAELKKGLFSAEFQKIGYSLVASLEKNAKITINNKVIKAFNARSRF